MVGDVRAALRVLHARDWVVVAVYVAVIVLVTVLGGGLWVLNSIIDQRTAERDALVSSVDALRHQVEGLGAEPDAPPPSSIIDAVPGRTGPTGAAGLRGAKGDTGATGPRGPTGKRGLKGDRGDNGQTVVGEPGTAGKDGEPGKDGVGKDGADGKDGVDGAPGPAGPAGPPGADSTVPGPQGVQGPPGPAPASFTFIDAAGVTFVCIDPDGDLNYTCQPQS